MTYEEFEVEFKKHHTCGIPAIPRELAYSSDCPRCCPEWDQWKEDCKATYEAGRTKYTSLGVWI